MFFNNSKRNFVPSRGHVISSIFFFPLPCSIYKDNSSKWSGFHNKTFQSPIKKILCRFQKCLANRALKEASDGNSTMFCGRPFHSFNYIYYMATIVLAFWLAAERARFPCNNRALLARCQRHIQPVFNLIVDIPVMVNWQLSKKGIRWPLPHDFEVVCWPGSITSGVLYLFNNAKKAI